MYYIILTCLLITFGQTYIFGQYKQDIDQIATSEVGKELIKELREQLQTADLSSIIIYLNKAESNTASLDNEDFDQQLNSDLQSIEHQKKLITDSKYHVAFLERKNKFIQETIKKYDSMIKEKQYVIDQTNQYLQNLEDKRVQEDDLYQQRRTILTMSIAIIRKAKGLIGQLVPKIKNLQPQTKFAKTDNEKYLNFEEFIQQFGELKTEANTTLGQNHPFTKILESFSQITTNQTGNIEHINSLLDLLAQMEQSLNDINLLLYNAEEEKEDFHQKLAEKSQGFLEQYQKQIEQLDNAATHLKKNIEHYEQEIRGESEKQQKLESELDNYIEAHEMLLTNHKADLQDKVLRIKLIRLLKEDFRNEFEATSTYMMSNSFNFQQ